MNWLKKLIPNKSALFDIVGLILLVLFYAVIPYILFLENYKGSNSPKISLGLCVFVIIVFIVCKRMFLNNHITALRSRVGTMNDAMKVERDYVKKNRLAYRVAWKNTLLVAYNLIVPILCIATVLIFIGYVENTAQALASLKKTINLASISFYAGVLTQIALPFVRAKLLQDRI